MAERKPTILVTMGDPAGVGPEVALKAVGVPAVRRAARTVVLGVPELLERTAECLGLKARISVLDSVEDVTGRAGLIEALPIEHVRRPRFRIGKASAAVGKLVLRMLEQATDMAIGDRVDAITTAPICKEAVQAAHSGFVGHTEFLAERTGTRDYCMMLSADRLRLTFVTTHCALARVVGLLRASRIRTVVRLTYDALAALGVTDPRVGVAGLNPHAGESGLFGDEEHRIIARAIRTLRPGCPGLSGPHPPDALFMQAYRGHYDAVVCMYHDQGHIPLKMVSFDRGVNTTLGLPIVRTSPDHGTAFDIAGRGVANPESTKEAILMAARLALHRRAKATSR